jgi:hypothetical protein
MPDIKTLVLPIASPEYDNEDEAITRRVIEMAIEDLNAKVTRIQKTQDSITSKALKRHQFLLMGMKHG